MLRKLLLCIALLLFISSTPVLASDVQTTGTILDSGNHPVANGIVTFTNSGGKTVGAAIADLNGVYTVLIPQGTYQISVSGPKGSTLPTLTLEKQTVSGSITRNFTLISSGASAVNINKQEGNKTIILISIAGVIFLTLFVIGVVLWKKRGKGALPEAGSSH